MSLPTNEGVFMEKRYWIASYVMDVDGKIVMRMGKYDDFEKVVECVHNDIANIAIMRGFDDDIDTSISAVERDLSMIGEFCVRHGNDKFFYKVESFIF